MIIIRVLRYQIEKEKLSEVAKRLSARLMGWERSETMEGSKKR